MIKKSKRDRMTPLLNELYWLPVKFRIEYKIATYVYRHFDNTGVLPKRKSFENS